MQEGIPIRLMTTRKKPTAERGVESRRHHREPDPEALTRALPACWEVCRMPRRPAGKRLASVLERKDPL